MKKSVVFGAIAVLSTSMFAANTQTSAEKIARLQQQSEAMMREIQDLKAQLKYKPAAMKKPKKAGALPPDRRRETINPFHDSQLIVHALDSHPENMEFYPTALLADEQVITYIAGTPVVSSPYTGDRPAFDGSDYIVNISSINRDIRLMQQRRKLYRAYEALGYPVPHMPIIALSGAVSPFAFVHDPYIGSTSGDLSLGGTELDVAAALNENVEAFISLAFDDSPLQIDGPRVDKARFFLNMGFINIGNLDKTPFYFTAGQLFAPFGRYSSGMISAPLTMRLGRIKTRPVILGYKTQHGAGFFGALFGFKSEATLGRSGAGGVNLGYTFEGPKMVGEIGASYVNSLTDAGGMQNTGPAMGGTFGGFSSVRFGNERVRKIPAVDLRGIINVDGVSFTAEWVGATKPFLAQDLSFNTRGAKPRAGQLEIGKTFMAFSKPASVAAGYQWSSQALALRLPKKTLLAAFSISLWKDTVESIEYRHDWDYKADQAGNGIAPAGKMNTANLGTGKSSDTISAQIGVYF